MSESYSDAAGRHYADGSLLEKNGRNENADQLYGFAAECAIKSALVRVPAFQQDGSLTDQHRHHIDVLWGRVSINAIQRSFPTLTLILRMDNPYSDWSVSQRYHRSGCVTTEQLDCHKNFSRRLLHAVGVIGQRGT